MEAELTPGTRFADYRIEALIGRGAMAEVYRARDDEEHAVALKLLDSASAHDERFQKRFLRESELAASIRHPHIVPTLAAGGDDGRLFLAMEYIDGTDLRGLLRADGRLDPERAVALLEQVAAALDAAHAAGLVHRDVKPGNILVDGEQAYVCDFGLARHVAGMSSLTGDRGFVGTIDYVSPEQIEGTAVDARTDVYSLGCVLYECLVGIRPFDRDSELSVVFAHLNEPPPKPTDARPELPAAFDDVIATALAKVPDERYSSCGELAAAARAALRGEVLARRRRPRRRRLLLALAVAIAIAVVVGVVLAMGGSRAAAVTITPTSIAGAKLGDTNLMLQRLWGRLHGSANLDFPQDYSEITYRGRGLTAFFVGSSIKTVEIATSNSSDRTAEGIGPCSTLAALKKAYGDRLKPNPHMIDPNNKAIVSGWMLGKHLLFVMGPVSTPTAATVATVALYDNDLSSAGYLAPGECVPGTANVVARPAAASRAATAGVLPKTLASKRFTPRLTLGVPRGWKTIADDAGVFRIEAPHRHTTVELRLDPVATSARGSVLVNVSSSANGLSAWLHRARAFNAVGPQGIHLGQPVLTVTSIDLAASAHRRPFFSFRSRGEKTIWSTGARTRVYLTPIVIRGVVHILAIAVRGAFGTADTIVRSIRVAATPTHEITAFSAQCTQPFGGTCRGEMPAGTYTSRTFKPALTFTVPVGWTNFNDAPGAFGMVPPDGDWWAVAQTGAPTNRIGVWQRVSPTGSRCGEDAAPVRSAAAYVRWLEALPGLSITNLKRAAVGGLSGFVLDLRIRRDWKKTCKWSHGVPAVQYLHGVSPTYPDMIVNSNPQPFVTRLYLLDYNHATFAIAIDAVEGSAKLRAYDTIVKSFHFKLGQ